MALPYSAVPTTYRDSIGTYLQKRSRTQRKYDSAVLAFFNTVAGNPEEYEESLDRWIETVSLKSGKTYYYHRRTRESKWTLSEEEQKNLLPPLDPYNNSLILPLASFVEFPMADELVNNAMTFQVILNTRRQLTWTSLGAGVIKCFLLGRGG